MFANLKNKLLEEVKSSQAFNSIASAAQAAVSKDSNSSSNSNSTPVSDSFFSITEDDTPQNSPNRSNETQKKTHSRVNSSSSNIVDFSSNNGNSLLPTTRTRKLSNSSMASDVSFRLPTYDPSVIHHLQSDLDISASEVEDNASNTRLDMISKEQLHDAYRKALDRYHKYRTSYTDLVKKYKDLERDSTKARTVLVETQDKAIRRINELREQCTLEQQAKAHLEEALRIEMDDMQCKIKMYQTKISLLGEQSIEPREESLIQLNEESQNNLVTVDLSSSISVKDLQEKLDDAENTIKELRKREEENVILLAQNKQAIHLELDNRESEMKKLRKQLSDQDSKIQQFMREKQNLEKEVEELHIAKDRIKQITATKQELEAKLISSEHILKESRKELKDKQDNHTKELNDIKQSLEEKIQNQDKKYLNLEIEYKNLNENNKVIKERDAEIERLNFDISLLKEEMVNLISLPNKSQILNAELEKAKQTIDELNSSNSLGDLQEELQASKLEIAEMKEKLKKTENIFTELSTLQNEIEDIRKSHSELQLEKQQLEEKIELMSSEQGNDEHKWKLLLKEAEDKYKDAECKLESVQTEMNQLLEKKSILEDNSHTLERIINENKNALESYLGDIEDYQEDSKKAHEASRVLNEKVTLLLNENSRLIKEKIEQDSDVQNLEDKLKVREDSFDSIKLENDNLNRENTNLNKVLNDLRNDLEDVTETEKTKSDENQRLKDEIDQLRSSLNDSEKVTHGHASELEQRIADLNSILDTNEKEMKIKNDELKILQTNVDVLNENCDKIQIESNKRLDELNKIKELNETLEKKILETENSTKSLTKIELELKQSLTIIEEHKKTIESLTKNVSQMENFKMELEKSQKSVEQLKDTVKASERIQDENANMKLEIEEMKRSTSVKDEEIGQLNGRLHTLENIEKSNVELKSNYENLEKNDKKLRDLLEEQLQKIEKLNQEYKRLHEQFESCEKERDALIASKISMEEQCKDVQTKLNSSQENQEYMLSEKDRKITELTSNIDELQVKITTLNNIETSLNDKLKLMNTDNSDLKSKSQKQVKILQDLQEKNKHLEEKMEQHVAEQTKRIDSLEKLCEEKDKTISKNLSDMDALKVSHKQELLLHKEDAETSRLEKTTLAKKVSELEKSSANKSDNETDFINLQKDYERLKTELSDIKLHSKDRVECLNQEVSSMSTKYKEMEDKFTDISSRNLFLEQQCEQFLILDQSNTRLKTQNEKLNKQLNNALSQEGISANTEFEYLKNIMFQYLTGTVSHNNETLVKVIAAVLKFSPQQTQVALEKEHQRRSLLGQLL